MIDAVLTFLAMALLILVLGYLAYLTGINEGKRRNPEQPPPETRNNPPRG